MRIHLLMALPALSIYFGPPVCGRQMCFHRELQTHTFILSVLCNLVNLEMFVKILAVYDWDGG